MQILLPQGEKYVPVEALIEALRQRYLAAKQAGQGADYLAGFAALSRGLKDGVPLGGGKNATTPTTQALTQAALGRAYRENPSPPAAWRDGLDAAALAVFAIAGPDATGTCSYCRKAFAAAGPHEVYCSERCQSRYEEGQR